MIQRFKQFLLKGNVLDLAVAVVIGTAFGTVITALVKDLLTPLIAAIGGQPDFSSLAFTFNGSRFMYGEFLNAVLAFMIVSAVVYFMIVVPVGRIVAHSKKEAAATTRKCPECLSDVPLQARRCAHCASEIDYVSTLRTG
jgi:large conductance mechanosensitive channel